MIPAELLQQIRERIDLADLVGRHVGLRRAGRHLRACCPFHQERTPSFYVDPARRTWRCYGCGLWGDAIDFVRQADGRSFLEAARLLGSECGVDVGATGGPAEEPAERDRAYAIVRAASASFAAGLAGPEGRLARAYLDTRRVGAEAVERFGIGYAPSPSESGAWDRLVGQLRRQGHDLALAERLGLVGRTERGALYDRFRGRLMFPIAQPGGALVGFSGRVLPEYAGEPGTPKYLNSPESLLYVKGRTLFGLSIAAPAMRRVGRAILVEGNLDVVTMHQRGHGETVAPLGTALTADQAALLRRFVEVVVLCLDGDAAGQRAAAAAIPILLDADLDVRVVALDPGTDPDSADAGRLADILAEPVPGIEWWARRMVAAGARDSPEAQERAVARLAPIVARVRNDGARARYVERVAALLGVRPARVAAPLRRSAPPPPPPRPEVRSDVVLLALLLEHPEVRSSAAQARADTFVAGPAQAAVAALLAGQPVDLPRDVQEQVELAAQHLHDVDDDPIVQLAGCLWDCARARLRGESRRLDGQLAEARARGDREGAAQIAVRKMALSRDLAELEGWPPPVL